MKIKQDIRENLALGLHRLEATIDSFFERADLGLHGLEATIDGVGNVFGRSRRRAWTKACGSTSRRRRNAMRPASGSACRAVRSTTRASSRRASRRRCCALEPSRVRLAVAAGCSYNPRVFTWDKDKCQENLDKHGIDFADAEKIFAGYTVTAEDVREAYGEQRFLTLGLLHGEVVSVTHTPREDDDHIISIRKATKHEARFYFSQVPD